MPATHSTWRLAALLAAIALVALATAWLLRTRERDWADAPADVRASLWPAAVALDGFVLEDQLGRPFTPERLRGGWTLVFFGYLQCPDVCPTTLSALRDMRRLQQRQHPGAEAPRVLFVSLDPEFDTRDGMASYLAHFDPAFTGARGSLEALQPLTAALHIMRIEREEGGLRSIDHTSSVIVIDPQGRAVGALPPPHEPAGLLARFESLRRYLAD